MLLDESISNDDEVIVENKDINSHKMQRKYIKDN